MSNYPIYYYSKADHKGICLRNEHIFIFYQCKRYDNGLEQVYFLKRTMPDAIEIENELKGFIPCEKEVYETVVKDYFAKSKEYRDIFYTKQNPL